MAENSFVVWDPSDGTALAIDPGCASAREELELEDFLSCEGIHLAAILLTHPHFDHLAGATFLCRNSGLECYVCESDRPLTERMEELGRMYGFQLDERAIPFRFFDAGEQSFQFGRIGVRVLPIGGHTPGSVAYYLPDAEAVFVGDTIAKGSLGFLETGFRETLESIRDYLFPLPDKTRLFPGHGEFSSVGEEKRGNRFFKRSADLL